MKCPRCEQGTVIEAEIKNLCKKYLCAQNVKLRGFL
jgi:hypothetical protein